MMRTRWVVNGLLVAAVALTTLTPVGNAATCCCPDHGQAAPCAMSCGPSESPEALQAAVPNVTKSTGIIETVPSTAARLAFYPAEILERFTTPHGESPPKRYLRYRVLRL